MVYSSTVNLFRIADVMLCKDSLINTFVIYLARSGDHQRSVVSSAINIPVP